MPRTKFQPSFDLNNLEVRKFIDTHAYEFANETMDTMLQRLRTVWNEYLKTGMDEGRTVYELTEDVEKVFAGETREDWGSARRIARTESVGSANMASLISYKNAGVPFKMWVTMEDDLVRGEDPKDIADHASLNGETIPIDDYFVVIGKAGKKRVKKKMQCPGDPMGGPENICNCRCALIASFEGPTRKRSLDDFVDEIVEDKNGSNL